MTGEREAHEGVIAIGDVRNVDSPAGLESPTVKFVHYPGSQQLILWLPKPAHEGYLEMSVTRDGVDVERGLVSSRMNGSVQILFATLEWPPGDYRIAITHKDGWRHEVALKKFAPGAEPPPPKPEPVVETPSSGPIVYRDGFGNVIPDADLEMRGRAREGIARTFGRRLEYEGNYRAGTIVYVDGDNRIRFSHEMAGGGAKFSIETPSKEHWEGFTKTPLKARDEIIAFVAERVRIEKASSWRYEITDEAINYYEE
ncbi:MAG: hypothetical protein QM773_14765 [Hyphomonadaceae bacterium]